VTLLVSRINNIKIIQVGESKLSIENKSEDGSKVGGSRKIGFIGDGENKTIDLGQGQSRHTLKFYVRNKKDNDEVLRILHKDRYCEIVDKFKGKIPVYVNSINVTDSDTHIDRTIYDISCSVQTKDLPKKPNYTVRLKSIIADTQKELPEMIKKLSEEVTTKKEDGLFVDEALALLSDAVESIYEQTDKTNGAYRSIIKRVDKLARIKKAIENITILPAQLSEQFAQDEVENNDDFILGVKPSKIFTDERDYDSLTQFKKEQYDINKTALEVVNKVKLAQDLSSIITGNWNKTDFDKVVDNIIERLDYCGYGQGEASIKKTTVKAYSNSREFRDIITVKSDGKPLVKMVWERYGSIDLLPRITALNGFKENDYITGDVRVFA
jgi:hypothetical protein